MKQGARDSIPIPSKLRVLHEDSRLISKIVPKIRIIHIFSPKIIKTDEANFKELVQSLTGQRACCKGSSSTSTSSTKNATLCQHKASREAHQPQSKKMVQLKERSNVQDSNHHFGVWNESNIQIVTPLSRKSTVSISEMVQVKGGFPISQNDEKVKKEFIEETYKGENSNSGFLMGTGLSYMDGLLQNPSEFPSLFSKYSQINVFGGMPMPWSLS